MSDWSVIFFNFKGIKVLSLGIKLFHRSDGSVSSQEHSFDTGGGSKQDH